jgi:hypothetical protein
MANRKIMYHSQRCIDTVANASGDTPEEIRYRPLFRSYQSNQRINCSKWPASNMVEELNHRRTQRPTGYSRSLYGRQGGSQENTMLRESDAETVEQS